VFKFGTVACVKSFPFSSRMLKRSLARKANCVCFCMLRTLLTTSLQAAAFPSAKPGGKSFLRDGFGSASRLFYSWGKRNILIGLK
jgi:hypothetical protein